MHNGFTTKRKRAKIMKKQIKKSIRTYIALILTIVMLIGMIPIYAIAFSDEGLDNKSNDELNAVETKEDETQSDKSEGESLTNEFFDSIIGTNNLNEDNSEDSTVKANLKTGIEICEQTLMILSEVESTYTVTFYVDGVPYSSKDVNAGEAVTAPINPGKMNLIFDAWYNEAGQKFAFDTPIYEDIALDAGFQAIVTFIISAGNQYEVRVNENQLVAEQDVPEKDGNTFIQWNSISGFFNFKTDIITKHTTLWAQFEAESSENDDTPTVLKDLVKYEKDNDTKTFSINSKHDASATCPTCGYKFETKDVEGVWFTQGSNPVFKYIEASCPNCDKSFLFTANNPEPSLSGGKAKANNFVLDQALLAATILNVRFLPGTDGTLSHNQVFQVKKDDDWQNSWVPTVTPIPGFIHTGWYSEQYGLLGVNGPFPDKVEQNLVFVAQYTKGQPLVLRPADETRVFNGGEQAPSENHYIIVEGLPTGYTIDVSDLRVSGSATNAGKYNNILTISNPKDIVIFDSENNVVTEDFAVTMLTGTLIINPAPITIKVMDAWKYVGESDPEFKGEATGFYNKDELDSITFHRTNFGKAGGEEAKLHENVLNVKEFTLENTNYYIFEVVPGNFDIRMPTYTVTFYSGAESKDKDVIEYDVRLGTVTKDIEPTFIGNKGWEFDSWSPKLASIVTEDASYTAQWKKIDGMWFTVRYEPGAQGVFEAQGYTDILIDTATPEFEVDELGALPEGNPGWTFAGWSPEWERTVTGSITYVAQWVKTEGMWFTVMYLPGSQGTFRAQIYRNRLLDTATPAFKGDTTGNKGWEFAGWKPEVDTTVTHSVKYVAQWKKTDGMWFTVKYEPGEQGAFDSQEYTDILMDIDTPAFEAVELGALPEGNPGWTFTGWDPEWESTVTANMTYVAQWEANSDIEVTVNYYLKDTTTSLAPSVTIKGLTMAGPYVGNALVIEGYTVDAATKTIVSLAVTGNEITFYYTKDTTVITTPVIDDPDPEPDPNPGPTNPNLDPVVPTNPDPDPEEPEEVEEVVDPESGATISTPVVPAAPTTPAANTAENVAEASAATTPVAPPTDDTQVEPEEDEAAAVIINDPDVPLAMFNYSGAWALWNLILSLAVAILAMMVCVRFLIRKRNDEKDDTEECDVDEEEKRRSRILFVLATPILAIVGIILFILTENMRLQMIMVDWWTLAHVILFAGAIISYIFAFKTEKNNGSDDDKAIPEIV